MPNFRPLYPNTTTGRATRILPTDGVDCGAQCVVTSPTASSPELLLDLRDNAGNTSFGVRVVDDGDDCMYIGDVAGQNHTAGLRTNLIIGPGAGGQITSGSGLFGIGARVLSAATTASDCTAVGAEALENVTQGSALIGIGSETLNSATTATSIVAIGDDAFRTVTTAFGGRWCTGVGHEVGFAVTTAQRCSYFGYQAGRNNTTGQRQSFFGYQAGKDCTGSGVILIGHTTNYSGSGGDNVAVGNTGLAITTGARNLILHFAGTKITTATDNVFAGWQAGNNASQKVDVSNSMALGANTYTDANNQVVIGDTSVVETILRGTTGVRIFSGTNAQTLEVYNTRTDSSNYERGNFEWVSNELRIGTEKAGTGTARLLAFQTDGTTRLSIGASGDITVADGENIILNTTTGTKVGTAATQKLGFWNATPIVQPSGATQGALTTNSGTVDGTIVDMPGDSTTTDISGDVDNNFADVTSRINAIRQALVDAGIIKGSA